MRVSFAFFLTLILVFSAVAFADHQFKYANPIELVNSANNPRYPEIAWSGSRYAIVYDDYNRGSSSGAYLLLVDQNGNVVLGPKKISTRTYALCPKIIWSGSEFVILYAEGTSTDNMNYYIERFNSSGYRISRNSLPGTCLEYNPYYAKLIWMGNRKEFGIFYRAIPPGDIRNYPLFCKVDSSGNPGQILQIYNSSLYYKDICWDGKRFVVFGGGVFYSWYSVGVAQLLVLDGNGKQICNGMGLVPIRYCYDVALLPLKKKKTYLLAYSGYSDTGASAPAVNPDNRYDYFTGQVKVKNKKVSNLNLKNTTKSLESGWTYPNGIIIGNKYYIAGGHGCGIAFAQIDDKGRIIGSPLFFEHSGG